MQNVALNCAGGSGGNGYGAGLCSVYRFEQRGPLVGGSPA